MNTRAEELGLDLRDHVFTVSIEHLEGEDKGIVDFVFIKKAYSLDEAIDLAVREIESSSLKDARIVQIIPKHGNILPKHRLWKNM